MDGDHGWATYRAVRGRRERGATLVEFVFVAPALLTLGLGALQTGLIYHAKSTLNYAAFEAARTGATHHARLEPMRDELAMRLAPIMGGDGSAVSAAAAIGRSRAQLADPMSLTRIEILNPTAEAFDDWGTRSSESGKRVIPNSHLRLQSRRVGAVSGLSLQDANLLKIEVTHGLKLRVPILGTVMAELLAQADARNAAFYRRGEFPLRAVATVRMQSEIWEESLAEAKAAGEALDGDAAVPGPAEPEPSGLVPPGTVAENGDPASAGEGAGGEELCLFGLGGESNLLQEASYADDRCEVGAGYGPSTGGGGPLAEERPPSSPVSEPLC